MHKQDVIVNWELVKCCGISSLEQSAASIQVLLMQLNTFMQSFKNLLCS